MFVQRPLVMLHQIKRRIPGDLLAGRLHVFVDQAAPDELHLGEALRQVRDRPYQRNDALPGTQVASGRAEQGTQQGIGCCGGSLIIAFQSSVTCQRCWNSPIARCTARTRIASRSWSSRIPIACRYTATGPGRPAVTASSMSRAVGCSGDRLTFSSERARSRRCREPHRNAPASTPAGAGKSASAGAKRSNLSSLRDVSCTTYTGSSICTGRNTSTHPPGRCQMTLVR